MNQKAVSRRQRLLGVVSATILALSSVLACSSSEDHGTPAGDLIVESTLEIELTGGFNIRGAELELSFQPTLTLQSITQVGDLVPATCEQNTAGQPVLVVCILDAPDEFNAPSIVWSVEFRHAFAVDVVDSVTGLTCSVSDEFGNVSPVACAIVN